MARPKKIEDIRENIPDVTSTEAIENNEISIKQIDVVIERRKSIDVKNTVSFQYEYPQNYKGQKYHTNGSISEISIESAKLFELRGIGKIID